MFVRVAHIVDIVHYANGTFYAGIDFNQQNSLKQSPSSTKFTPNPLAPPCDHTLNYSTTMRSSIQLEHDVTIITQPNEEIARLFARNDFT